MYEYSTLVAHPYDTSVKALKTVQTYSKEEVIYKFTSDMNQTNLICATSPVYILDCIQKETRTARDSERTVESAMGSRGISDTLASRARASRHQLQVICRVICRLTSGHLFAADDSKRIHFVHRF